MVEARGACVTILGLGSMGSAIAARSSDVGHPVIGWNRTVRPEVAGRSGSATLSDDLAAAVQDSWLVIAVPSTYQDTRSALGDAAADGLLKGRLLLNLSWGSLDEASVMDRWCRDAGADYLDGAILCYPDEIRAGTGRVVVSGQASSLADVLGVLGALGVARHVGSDPAAANAVGSAAGIVFYHSALAAALEALAFASRFGVSPSSLVPELHAMLDLLSVHVPDDVARIERGDYAMPSASTSVHLDGVRMVLDDLASVGQHSPLMRGFVELVQPLVDEGYGDQSIARLYESLRS